MIIRVITIDGVKEVRAEAIQNSPDGRVETLGKKGWKPSNTVALLASKLFAS